MPIETEHLDQMVEDEWPEAMQPYCLACGYDLRGSVNRRCSECGRVFIRREWQRYSREIRMYAMQLRDTAMWISLAFKGVIFGAVLLGLSKALGGTVVVLGIAVGFLCGISGVFIGLGVFKVKRMPKWARERFEANLSFPLALSTIALGLVLAAASVFCAL